MPALLFLLLLQAPADHRQWSKSHGVGVWFPKTWKIVARDQEARAFVVEGPRLGPGIPRMVLWNAGSGAGTLDATATKLAAQVANRAGWQVVVKARKRIGPWPAVRIGIRFVEKGSKGRARFTVALIGGSFFVLELSAAASHFPGATFDRIERSLAVRWRELKLPAGLVTEVPAGWAAVVKEGRLVVNAPALGVGPSVLFLEAAAAPARGSPGPRVLFLGRRRETVSVDRKLATLTVRRVDMQAEGFKAVMMMPVPHWKDYFPVMEEILKRARRPQPK